MRIQVQTSFTTVLSENLGDVTTERLEKLVVDVMKDSNILTFKTENGSKVILSPQLLVNSVVTINKE